MAGCKFVFMGTRRRKSGVQARLELVVDLAQALHSCDTNAARLETTVADVGRALDLDGLFRLAHGSLCRARRAPAG